MRWRAPWGAHETARLLALIGAAGFVPSLWVAHAVWGLAGAVRDRLAPPVDPYADLTRAQHVRMALGLALLSALAGVGWTLGWCAALGLDAPVVPVAASASAGAGAFGIVFSRIPPVAGFRTGPALAAGVLGALVGGLLANVALASIG